MRYVAEPDVHKHERTLGACMATEELLEAYILLIFPLVLCSSTRVCQNDPM